MATNFYVLAAIAALLAVSVSGANAQQTNDVTVADLGTITNANIRKAAQLTGAELDNKLRKLGADSQPVAAREASSGAASAARSAVDDVPVIQSVYGAGGELFATLVYTDGRRASDVTKGARLAGGYEIRALAANSATLCRGRKCVVIGFADKAVTPVKPASNTNPYAAASPFTPPMVAPMVPASGDAQSAQ